MTKMASAFHRCSLASDAPSRQEDRDIAGLQRECAPALAAELHDSDAAGDAQNLVDARMIVHIVINPVTPGIFPTIALEQVFEDRRWIEPLRKPNGAPIND